MEISMLKSVIQQATNCNSSEVVPEARLINDLKMDASGAIVCAQQIKGVLQVEVPADEILKSETVGNLLKLINMKRKEAGKTMTLNRDEVIGHTPSPTPTPEPESKDSGNRLLLELEMFLGILLVIIAVVLAVGHNIPGLNEIEAIANQSNNVINIASPVIAGIGGLMFGWGWRKLHQKKS